ncbi:MAG: hypothetical protein Q9222_000865 [Ikaeria aurantiellina]
MDKPRSSSRSAQDPEVPGVSVVSVGSSSAKYQQNYKERQKASTFKYFSMAPILLFCALLASILEVSSAATLGTRTEHPPPTKEDSPNCPSPLYPGTASPFLLNFTSTHHVAATPDQVVNGSTDPTFTGGLEGCYGTYDFGINAGLDFICYSIKIFGFRGEYQSPAKTATHVHEAAKGRNGPPRLAFPNPVGDGHERSSVGCLSGPFTTGLFVNGTDTGTGFKVSQIEENPAGFFADIHSSLAVPGAVRGQLR